MDHLPLYIPIVFILTVLLTVFVFFKATRGSAAPTILVFVWLAIQAAISYTGFYTETQTLPPRFLVLVLPPFLLILLLFTGSRGRRFIDRLDIRMLVLIHIVRVPVELVLFWLSKENAVPTIMTFEGRNFDIFAGVTAPAVYYFRFIRPIIGKSAFIIWNLACLALLFNVVVHGILSVATPFQKFAFAQPNVAVLYFPYVWLPCLVVQVVLFSHLAAIRKTMKGHKA